MLPSAKFDRLNDTQKCAFCPIAQNFPLVGLYFKRIIFRPQWPLALLVWGCGVPTFLQLKICLQLRYSCVLSTRQCAAGGCRGTFYWIIATRLVSRLFPDHFSSCIARVHVTLCGPLQCNPHNTPCWISRNCSSQGRRWLRDRGTRPQYLDWEHYHECFPIIWRVKSSQVVFIPIVET